MATLTLLTEYLPKLFKLWFTTQIFGYHFYLRLNSWSFQFTATYYSNSPSQFNYLNDKMKFATIFLCTLVLAISVSSYDLTPTQARKMRAQCLNECSADCPKNAINIMEGNCKSICKKGELRIFVSQALTFTVRCFISDEITNKVVGLF